MAHTKDFLAYVETQREKGYPAYADMLMAGVTKDRLWSAIDHHTLDDVTGPAAQEMLRVIPWDDTETAQKNRADTIRAVITWKG